MDLNQIFQSVTSPAVMLPLSSIAIAGGIYGAIKDKEHRKFFIAVAAVNTLGLSAAIHDINPRIPSITGSISQFMADHPPPAAPN